MNASKCCVRSITKLFPIISLLCCFQVLEAIAADGDDDLDSCLLDDDDDWNAKPVDPNTVSPI